MKWIFDPEQHSNQDLAAHFGRGDDIVCPVCGSPLRISGNQSQGIVSSAVCSKSFGHLEIVGNSKPASDAIEDKIAEFQKTV